MFLGGYLYTTLVSLDLRQADMSKFKPSRPHVDVLTATASSLRGLLESGALRSVDLVDLYLSQIAKHNHKGANLHAMISTVPRDVLLSIARQLDEEREAGNSRGPLHGIPMIVKDNMCTAAEYKVATTSGTLAYKDTVASKTAPSIASFIQAGAIILGKANLSVMAGMKAFDVLTGWSEVEGQTQSAYIEGGVVPGDTFLGHSVPGGSSSGSAVAVSAGFAPISLGTETDGSIMAPADRASLYAIKVTPGLVSVAGTLPYTPFSDSIGPLAKSSQDIADMLDVLTGTNFYSKQAAPSWDQFKVGLLDPLVWKSSPAASKPLPGYLDQVFAEVSAAGHKMAKAGCKVKMFVDLRRFDGGDDEQLQNIAWHDYERSFNSFVAEYFDNPEVKTMKMLIEFNNRHAQQTLPSECPDQNELLDAIKNANNLSPEKYTTAMYELRQSNKRGLETTMQENGVDILLGTPTGRFPTIAAAAGWPCGMLPLGYSKQNGRPFGLMVVVRPHREDLLVLLMQAWEALFGSPRPPPQLLEEDVAKI